MFPDTSDSSSDNNNDNDNSKKEVKVRVRSLTLSGGINGEIKIHRSTTETKKLHVLYRQALENAKENANKGVASLTISQPVVENVSNQKVIDITFDVLCHRPGDFQGVFGVYAERTGNTEDLGLSHFKKLEYLGQKSFLTQSEVDKWHILLAITPQVKIKQKIALQVKKILDEIIAPACQNIMVSDDEYNEIVKFLADSFCAAVKNENAKQVYQAKNNSMFSRNNQNSYQATAELRLGKLPTTIKRLTVNIMKAYHEELDVLERLIAELGSELKHPISIHLSLDKNKDYVDGDNLKKLFSDILLRKNKRAISKDIDAAVQIICSRIIRLCVANNSDQRVYFRKDNFENFCTILFNEYEFSSQHNTIQIEELLGNIVDDKCEKLKNILIKSEILVMNDNNNNTRTTLSNNNNIQNEDNNRQLQRAASSPLMTNRNKL